MIGDAWAIVWTVLQMVALAGVGALLVAPAAVLIVRRRSARRLAAAKWEPRIVTAQKAEADYYAGNGYSVSPLRGEVAVRIVKHTSLMTMGTLKVDDADFEERLSSLVATAEDRAAALNAAEVEVA